MPVDLDTYFEAERKAYDELQKALKEMDAAYGDGKSEAGKALANKLRPKVITARHKWDHARAIHTTMRNMTTAGPGNPAAGDRLSRAAFVSLESGQQNIFMQAEGKLIKALPKKIIRLPEKSAGNCQKKTLPEKITRKLKAS